MDFTLHCDPHPLLDPLCFVTLYPKSLANLPSPPSLLELFDTRNSVPLDIPPLVKKHVRDLLRHGGYKPTGRNKPASEYLIKAVDKGWSATTEGINLAGDACNVASFRSGLPISVVEAQTVTPPLSIQICPAGTRYVFNPSGQILEVGGLVSLCDAKGPCAGPVKDSQRTKTSGSTTITLSTIWGTRQIPGYTRMVSQWYRSLLHECGCATHLQSLVASPRA